MAYLRTNAKRWEMMHLHLAGSASISRNRQHLLAGGKDSKGKQKAR
jgi:hypothetical protein